MLPISSLQEALISLKTADDCVNPVSSVVLESEQFYRSVYHNGMGHPVGGTRAKMGASY